MEFRTPINTAPSEQAISHEQKLMIMGSCFSQNIGDKLVISKFDVCLNPFGVIYNPASIAQSLQLLLDQKQLTEQDLIHYNEQYHSFYHHGSYSQNSPIATLESVNESMALASQYLRNTNRLIITFGTAYVYKHIASEMIVSNCHKLPAKEFVRYRLSVDEVVDTWKTMIENIRAVNPSIHITFTVSPIRHLRDGMHDNQISKSTLLLAIESLQQLVQNTSYFPAYEIVLDDLRDYRFYADDMVHPSGLAIQYIWEKFVESYFDARTQNTITEWSKIQASISHRPFSMESDESQSFFKQTLLRLEQFALKYDYICVTSERQKLKERILS